MLPLLVCGGANALDAVWPTGALPKVLLDSPVNLTWAANQGAYWTDRGIDGFLLRGIVDDLDALPKDGNDASLLPLLEELRLARARLEEAGVSRFFIRLALGPEAVWFTDRDRKSVAEEALRRAGAICQRSGMTGLALDLRAAPALYYPQWDGYPASTHADLADQTRLFARDILRAFYRVCPDGNVIVLCPAPDKAGPLFFRVLDGIVESIGAATGLRQHLIFPQPAPSDTPESLAAIQTILSNQFSVAAGETWRSVGKTGFSVFPLARDTGGVANRMTADEFARRKAFLQLYSDDFVVVDDPDGAWWSATDRDADQLSGLLQSGAARVAARHPLPGWAEEWTCRLPFENLVRAGGLDVASGTVQVMQSALGSAVFFPRGTQRVLGVPDRTQPLYVSRATTGFSERDIAPARDGVVSLPAFNEAVLVDGLPIHQWLLPASLKFEVASPFYAQSNRPESTLRNVARFSIKNPAPAALEGQLEVIAGTGYSVGAATFDVTLPAGERLEWERHIQGVPRLGDVARFDVVFRALEGRPTTRNYPYPVRPPAVSTTQMFGPVERPPLLLPDAPGKAQRIIAASTMGDVRGIKTDLQDGWMFQHRFLDIVAIESIPGADSPAAVAMLDASGRIRVLSADGELLLSPRVPAFEHARALTVQRYGEGMTAFVAINRVGETVAMKSDGVVLWRADRLVSDGKASKTGLRALSDGTILRFATGATGKIECLAIDGTIHYTRTLSLSAPPAFQAGDHSTLFLGMEDGQVVKIRATDGRTLGIGASLDQPVQWANPLNDGSLLVGIPDRVALFDENAGEVWAFSAANPTPADVVTMQGQDIMILGCDEGRYQGAVEARHLRDGSLWWRDASWPAPVHAPPRWVDIENDGWPEAVVCGTDRRVQVLDLKQAWRTREDRRVH